MPGCIIRSGTRQRVVGPVWYRTAAPPKGKAHVLQVRTLPFLIELGGQTGLSLGFADRVTVAPEICGEPPRAKPGFPETDGWDFSLLQIVVEHPSGPLFHTRGVWGAELGAGEAHRGVTVGYAYATHFLPQTEGFYDFAFASNAPMETILRLRRHRPGHSPTASELFTCQ